MLFRSLAGAFPLKINNNDDAKISLQGSNNPYIQFREGSTNKAEVAWSADGYLKLNNSEDGSQLRIQDDLKFSVDGSTFYSVLTSNSNINASTVNVTAQNSVAATVYPLFAGNGATATGSLTPSTDTGFTYNSSTGELTTARLTLDHGSGSGVPLNINGSGLYSLG